MWKALSLITIGILLSCLESQAQFASTDPSIWDNGGVCTKPPIALNASALNLYNPLQYYYIPLASKALFRAEFEILHNRVAASEAEVAALQTRVRPLAIAGLLKLTDFYLTFYQGNGSNYGYQCLPTSAFVYLPNPLAVLFDVTCTVPAGSPGIASSDSIGNIYFTVIWSDGIAFTVWGCIKGVPNFHILSPNPTLTDAQIQANKDVLFPLGFSENNFQYMQYTSTS